MSTVLWVFVQFVWFSVWFVTGLAIGYANAKARQR